MQWSRTILQNQQQIDLIIALVVLLFTVSLFIDQQLLFLFVGLLVSYLSLIRLYNKRIGKKLVLINPKRFSRLFMEEELSLQMELHNDSLIPYLEGYLSFDTSNNVICNRYFHIRRGQWNNHRIAISMVGKQKITVTVPFKAISRGFMHIRNIRYTFSHPLTFQNVDLTFKEQYRTRAIIYPTSKLVHNVENGQDRYFGNDTSMYSAFEDLLQPISTRDYLHSDSFKRIHWKASAKRQELQTKVYQHNQNFSWVITINIAVKSPLGNYYASGELENYLSEAAYMANYLIRQGFPVELFVNHNTYSGPLHVKEGKGIDHFKKILEALAVVNYNDIYPMNHIFHMVDKRHHNSQRIILIGELNCENLHYLSKLKAKGHQLYHIEQSTLLPYMPIGRDKLET
ncbi:DUF58 domain-containing protein [Oceanobacillus massiliensis]|uniref:DUF58 domain-containing protein n=1 Tax=Oceanobacillus massiliensis TaxID=1465765 RepID=UPI000287ABEF|nr:DUF58 domain-containing protein [Oceanobacillus massiliensis]